MNDKERKAKLEVYDYIYNNKNGLEKDFIAKFGKKEFESMALIGNISYCQRLNGDNSWKITKSCYDWYIVAHPELKYKHWTTRIMDFMNYWLHFKWIKKEHLENERRKENYFQGLSK